MSAHPNVLLILDLEPEDLPMKTWRAIMEEYSLSEDDDFTIGGERFHHACFQSGYDTDWQISSKSGNIVIFGLVTYGYGQSIPFDKLLAIKEELLAFGGVVAGKHKCKALPIRVSANYW